MGVTDALEAERRRQKALRRMVMQVSERHVGVLVDEIVASLKREAILQEQAERLGAHH